VVKRLRGGGFIVMELALILLSRTRLERLMAVVLVCNGFMLNVQWCMCLKGKKQKFTKNKKDGAEKKLAKSKTVATKIAI
jgi:hypothetical protein